MATTNNRIPRCSGCNVSYSVIDQEWQHAPSCLIARQAHGEPLPDASGADIEVVLDPRAPIDAAGEKLVGLFLEFKTAFEANYSGSDLLAKSDGIETNGFDFYIDGYTIGLSGPEGNLCLVRDPHGREIMLKRKALTDFLARRFEPSVDDRNLTG